MIYVNGQPTAEFVPEIADNLTTDDSSKALSAKQGKVLNEKIDDYHDWHSIASGVQSADVSGTDYNEYLVTVVLTHASPNGCVTFHLFRGINAFAGTSLLYVAGDWATGQYGTAVEIIVDLSGNIDINSVYSNGQNVKTSARMYVMGKY